MCTQCEQYIRANERYRTVIRAAMAYVSSCGFGSWRGTIMKILNQAGPL